MGDTPHAQETAGPLEPLLNSYKSKNLVPEGIVTHLDGIFQSSTQVVKGFSKDTSTPGLARRRAESSHTVTSV